MGKLAIVGLPTLSIAASESGYRAHQPDTERLGELLCDRKRQRVLRVHQGLGRKEDQTPYDAISEAQGLRLDTME